MNMIKRNVSSYLFGFSLLYISPQIFAENTNKIMLNERQSTQLTFAPPTNKANRSKVKQWLLHAANALSLVYGEMPVNHFLTRIHLSHTTDEIVPWGEVTRNYPPEVFLIINSNSSLAELKRDWTIYHELSHLLIPYDNGDARWFSEGLASYYQNIIQARSGMFSERKMWQKLFEGFVRGDKQNNFNHQPLAKVSDQIDRNRNYMRIYWSGALYWLKADIALRQLNSSMTLDNALKQLQRCCFDRYLSAKEITKQLDTITNSKIFSDLFKSFAQSYHIPEYKNFLTALGVSVNNHTISLNNQSKYSALRKSIYQGTSDSDKAIK